MAKSIWVCSRKELPKSVYNDLSDICQALTPDNIIPAEPVIQVNGKVAFGIMNPTRTISIRGNSLLMGKILDEKENWHIPMEDFPDGSYALFRDGDGYCEIVSDPVASRTIWYYMDNEVFVASTSQRAIILFIGGFEFNEEVIPWMLSTGSLGPRLSWDKRISQLAPDSSVILDKKSWTTRQVHNPIHFSTDQDPDKNHEEDFLNTLKSTFRSLELNFDDWVLPLSGGYDSRGILCLLHETGKTKDLQTITWGLKSSVHDKNNDAWVAKKLAETFDLPHKYFHTDVTEEPMHKILNRFLLNGEGRVDHVSGYMDGFKIWKTLYDNNIQGIIRGDVGFGGMQISSPFTVRREVGFQLCTDFINLANYTDYKIPIQKIPEYLELKPGESLETWRDRLYDDFRLPTVQAALSDLKLSYVEIVNPFLFRKILGSVRELPDFHRTGKTLFKKIVNFLSPDIHYAKIDATAKEQDILKQRSFVELIRQELTSNYAEKIFAEEFLKSVLENMTVAQGKNAQQQKNKPSLKSTIKNIMPIWLINAIRDKVPATTKIGPNLLAFRIFIIIRMYRLLSTEKSEKLPEVP